MDQIIPDWVNASCCEPRCNVNIVTYLYGVTVHFISSLKLPFVTNE